MIRRWSPEGHITFLCYHVLVELWRKMNNKQQKKVLFQWSCHSVSYWFGSLIVRLWAATSQDFDTSATICCNYYSHYGSGTHGQSHPKSEGLFTLAIFSSEKRVIFLLRLVLVFSFVLFTLAIFQWFSQVRTKIAGKQMGAVSIQASHFCKQTINKYRNRLEK